MTLQEGIEVVEVDFARVTEMKGVLVAALARLGGTALFIVEITGDAELVSVEAEGRPKYC